MQEKNKELDYLANYIILRAFYENGLISEKRFVSMNKISALNCNVAPIVDDFAHSQNLSK